MLAYLSERMITGHLSSFARSLGRDHLNTKIIEAGFSMPEQAFASQSDNTPKIGSLSFNLLDAPELEAVQHAWLRIKVSLARIDQGVKQAVFFIRTFAIIDLLTLGRFKCSTPPLFSKLTVNTD